CTALCHLCYHCVAACLLRFFFSSRRRHTRSKRDWSSDVCSSDLLSLLMLTLFYLVDLNHQFRSYHLLSIYIDVQQQMFFQSVLRSEERRVGKECRSRR